MLLILPYLDVFQHCFDKTHSSLGRLAMRVLYQHNNKILVSKTYVNYLESYFPNKDYFQNLLKEIFDSGRVETVTERSESKSIEDEFIFLANLKQRAILFPITFVANEKVNKEVPFLCIEQKAKRPNVHWMKLELASNAQFVVNHLHFSKDSEISNFFDSIFSLPRFIKSVYIFDREQSSKHKTKLKGKNIKYFTLFRNATPFEKRIALNDLRNKLGGKLEMWTTNNGTLIHERKIIFENLVLMCDNSFENINKNEPTWEIVFYYSPDTAKDWTKKCLSFKQFS